MKTFIFIFSSVFIFAVNVFSYEFLSEECQSEFSAVQEIGPALPTAAELKAVNVCTQDPYEDVITQECTTPVVQPQALATAAPSDSPAAQAAAAAELDPKDPNYAKKYVLQRRSEELSKLSPTDPRYADLKADVERIKKDIDAPTAEAESAPQKTAARPAKASGKTAQINGADKPTAMITETAPPVPAVDEAAKAKARLAAQKANEEFEKKLKADNTYLGAVWDRTKTIGRNISSGAVEAVTGAPSAIGIGVYNLTHKDELSGDQESAPTTLGQKAKAIGKAAVDIAVSPVTGVYNTVKRLGDEDCKNKDECGEMVRDAAVAVGSTAAGGLGSKVIKVGKGGAKATAQGLANASAETAVSGADDAALALGSSRKVADAAESTERARKAAEAAAEEAAALKEAARKAAAERAAAAERVAAEKAAAERAAAAEQAEARRRAAQQTADGKPNPFVSENRAEYSRVLGAGNARSLDEAAQYLGVPASQVRSEVRRLTQKYHPDRVSSEYANQANELTQILNRLKGLR